jgi:hypothetical protein
VNPLSPTERANVQLALSNLNRLIEDGRQLLPEHPANESEAELRRAAERELDTLREILANLRAKFTNGGIHSVPRLKTGIPRKYRENSNPPSSPRAAYCDDDTRIRDANHWVQCPEGDIVVDGGILDPRGGRPIDEANPEGWKQKWTLLHILAHEKMHEILINEQVEILKHRPWWPGQPEGRKEQMIREAKRQGATPEKHQKVYEWQKNVLRWEHSVLERELRRLNAERPPNQARIRDVQRKIDWLTSQVAELERKMASATSERDFAFAACSWPEGFASGLVAIYVTTPGLYWRIDVAVQNGKPVGFAIAETNWLGEKTEEKPLPGQPALVFALSETAFSAMGIQPKTCEYIKEATEAGEIVVGKRTDDVRSFIDKQIGFSTTKPSLTPQQK